MKRLTVKGARDVVARAYGISATDKAGDTQSRLLDLMNEAEERLLNRPGKPVGSYGRYRFRVSESCVVLPRFIRTVERASICNRPAMPMPEWFEFLYNGTGQLDPDDDAGDTVVDHGTDCKFDNFTPGATDRKIRITTDVAEDAATYIWLYGYDENANWIRTQVGGEWVDGERIDLSACPQQTSNLFTSLVRVKKDDTKGPVRLYEYNTTSASVVRALAVYEPSESDPIYRVLFIPNVENMGKCEGEEDCDDIAITVFARLQHIPVSSENDAFVIGNLAALKLMVLAIKAEEEQRLADAMQYQAMAEKELDGELAAHLGDGQKIGLTFEAKETFGGGFVENVV